jgi:hypothetical protein
MIWTNRISVAFPISMIEGANHLAAIIDPDTGGNQTFSIDRLKGDYIYAEIPFIEDFLPLVMSKDPAIWFSTMTQLAESKNHEPLTQEQVDALCNSILIGDECNVLEEEAIIE